jgi:hypothetical protein
MKYFTYLTTLTVLIAFFFLMFSQKAYAYLDPGSGSYIIQMIIAALLGGLFAIKIFWRNVKTFFANLFSKQQKDDD